MSAALPWAEALSVVDQTIGRDAVRQLATRAHLKLGQPEAISRLASFTVHASTDQRPREVSVLVNPRILDWYAVEQVEALVCIAVWCLRDLNREAPAWIERTCARIGVDHFLYTIPQSRWYRIEAGANGEPVPVLRFEDRPACALCSRPVGTGHAKRHVHDNCTTYVHHILVPARRLQIEREKGSGV
jgi:hypothetical protein